MHGVKLPQPRDLVHRPVNPVGKDVDGKQNLDELQPVRLRRNGFLEIKIDGPEEISLNRNDGKETDQLHADVADHEVLHVRDPAAAQNALIGVFGKQSLKRYEHQR